MSMEHEPRPGDTQAAMELIEGHPLLKMDPYAKRVAETGKADNNQIVDIGNFLASRAAVLEKRKAEVVLAASERKDRVSHDAAVVYGVDPEMEKNWEN